MLTVEEALEGGELMDAVGRCGACIDAHDEDGGVRPACLRGAGGAKGWYHDPYRILLQRNVDGLFTASRCVSADNIAHGSMRKQAGYMLTGHAAGTAAALSIQEGVTQRNHNVEVLQTSLRIQGAIIQPQEGGNDG